MIDELLKRRPIKEFLKNYSSKVWSEVLTDVFEIGVLNLKNSFDSLRFTKEEFNSILSDLRDIDRKNSKSNKDKRDAQVKKQDTKEHPQSKKPSKPQIKRQEEFPNLKQPTYSNRTEEEEESLMEESQYTSETEESKQETIGNKGNRNAKPTTFKAEVYIPNEEEIRRRSRSNSKNRPRKQYYITPEEIKERNKENNRNLYYAESKIRSQVLNDKMIHQALKRNQIPQPTSSQYQPKNSGTNYCINYDKDLKPESIQKKEKETPMYYYSKPNPRNNFNTLSNEVNAEENSEQHYDSEGEQANQLNYSSNAYNTSDIISTNTNNAIYSATNKHQFSDQISNSYDQQGINMVNRTDSNPKPNSNSFYSNYQSINSNQNQHSIPVINSLNTVETANFNMEQQRNDNAQLYYQGDSHEGEQYDSNEKKGNISFKNNEEEKGELLKNKLMQSGKSEDELSMCNLSQRTKSKILLFRREMDNWGNNMPSQNQSALNSRQEQINPGMNFSGFERISSNPDKYLVNPKQNSAQMNSYKPNTALYPEDERGEKGELLEEEEGEEGQEDNQMIDSGYLQNSNSNNEENDKHY